MEGRSRRSSLVTEEARRPGQSLLGPTALLGVPAWLLLPGSAAAGGAGFRGLRVRAMMSARAVTALPVQAVVAYPPLTGKTAPAGV